MANNKPIHEIRLGSVKAAIWANDTDSGTRYNVKVARLYRDGESWNSTDSFGRDDLPLLAKVVDLAHTWIFVEAQDGICSEPNGSRRRNGRPNART